MKETTFQLLGCGRQGQSGPAPGRQLLTLGDLLTQSSISWSQTLWLPTISDLVKCIFPLFTSKLKHTKGTLLQELDLTGSDWQRPRAGKLPVREAVESTHGTTRVAGHARHVETPPTITPLDPAIPPLRPEPQDSAPQVETNTGPSRHRSTPQSALENHSTPIRKGRYSHRRGE